MDQEDGWGFGLSRTFRIYRGSLISGFYDDVEGFFGDPTS